MNSIMWDKCNQCGDTFLYEELVYYDKKDGPYCIYCVREWDDCDDNEV